MALPSGITTATVNFGPATDFLGNQTSTTVTFTPSVSLLWAATGQPVIAFPETATAAAGVQGSIVLPHTDQAGFTNHTGVTPISNWSYIVTGEWVSDTNEKIVFRREFQLPTGTSTLDLDTVPGAVGTTAPPSTIGPPGPPGTPAQWTEITQTEYDELSPPNPNTLYVIVG